MKTGEYHSFGKEQLFVSRPRRTFILSPMSADSLRETSLRNNPRVLLSSLSQYLGVPLSSRVVLGTAFLQYFVLNTIHVIMKGITVCELDTCTSAMLITEEEPSTMTWSHCSGIKRDSLISWRRECQESLITSKQGLLR